MMKKKSNKEISKLGSTQAFQPSNHQITGEDELDEILKRFEYDCNIMLKDSMLSPDDKVKKTNELRRQCNANLRKMIDKKLGEAKSLMKARDVSAAETNQIESSYDLIKFILSKFEKSNQIYIDIKNDNVPALIKHIENNKASFKISPVSFAIFYNSVNSFKYLLESDLGVATNAGYEGLGPIAICLVTEKYHYLPMLLAFEIDPLDKIERNMVISGLNKILPSRNDKIEMFKTLLALNYIYTKENGYFGGKEDYDRHYIDLISQINKRFVSENFGDHYLQYLSHHKLDDHVGFLDITVESQVIINWALNVNAGVSIYSLDVPARDFLIIYLNYSQECRLKGKEIREEKTWGELILAYKTTVAIIKRLEIYKSNKVYTDFESLSKKWFKQIDINEIPLLNKDLKCLQSDIPIDNMITIFKERLRAIRWLCGENKFYMKSRLPLEAGNKKSRAASADITDYKPNQVSAKGKSDEINTTLAKGGAPFLTDISTQRSTRTNLIQAKMGEDDKDVTYFDKKEQVLHKEYFNEIAKIRNNMELTPQQKENEETPLRDKYIKDRKGLMSEIKKECEVAMGEIGYSSDEINLVLSSDEEYLKSEMDELHRSNPTYAAIKADNIDSLKESLQSNNAFEVPLLSYAIYCESEMSLIYLLESGFNKFEVNEALAPFFVAALAKKERYMPLLLAHDVPCTDLLEKYDVKKAMENIVPSFDDIFEMSRTLMNLNSIPILLKIKLSIGKRVEDISYELKSQIREIFVIEKLGNHYLKYLSPEVLTNDVAPLDILLESVLITLWALGSFDVRIYSLELSSLSPSAHFHRLNSIMLQKDGLITSEKTWGDFISAYQVFEAIIKRLEMYKRDQSPVDFKAFSKKWFRHIDIHAVPILNSDLEYLKSDLPIDKMLAIFRERLRTIRWLCGVNKKYTEC